MSDQALPLIIITKLFRGLVGVVHSLAFIAQEIIRGVINLALALTKPVLFLGSPYLAYKILHFDLPVGLPEAELVELRLIRAVLFFWVVAFSIWAVFFVESKSDEDLFLKGAIPVPAHWAKKTGSERTEPVDLMPFAKGARGAKWAIFLWILLVCFWAVETGACSGSL